MALSPTYKSPAETQGQSQTTHKLGNLHQPLNRYLYFVACALKLEVRNGICSLACHKCDPCTHTPSHTNSLYALEVQLRLVLNPGII